MIKTKKELKQYLKEDNCAYEIKNRNTFYMRFVKEEFYWIDRYLTLLRKEEYYTNNIEKNRLNIIIAAIITRRKNRIGRKVNLSIAPNCAGKGLTIFHSGVVINTGAILGEYCSLHGENCVGNNGKNNKSPELGDHVDIGYSSCIIGGVHIANDVRIGAGAVVTKDCLEPGVTLIGIPAKVHR